MSRRCPWAETAPELTDYHDREWGRPVRTDQGLFERLALEAFQSGLSWLTILRKREAFRRAFSGFEIALVAGYGGLEVDRLLADAGIVRNRAKIEATIGNAGAALELEDEGGLAAFLWSFAPPRSGPPPKDASAVPATTAESTAMAKALKRRGFRFVGPTTCYAMMQATGMVDDHVDGCVARAPEGRG